jgi:hypothetical protein
VACANIRSAMKERFDGFKSCHLAVIVSEGIKGGKIEEVEVAKRGKVALILRPSQVPF